MHAELHVQRISMAQVPQRLVKRMHVHDRPDGGDGALPTRKRVAAAQITATWSKHDDTNLGPDLWHQEEQVVTLPRSAPLCAGPSLNEIGDVALALVEPLLTRAQALCTETAETYDWGKLRRVQAPCSTCAARTHCICSAGLYVGSRQAAETVMQANLTFCAHVRGSVPSRNLTGNSGRNPIAIVNCAGSPLCHNLSSHIELPASWHYYAPAQDTPWFDIVTYFRQDVRDVLSSLVAKRSAIVVACHAGINRSCAVVLLHLLDFHKLSLRDALALVLGAQPYALQNQAFVRRIAEYAIECAYANALSASVHLCRSTKEQVALLLGFTHVGEEPSAPFLSPETTDGACERRIDACAKRSRSTIS